MIGGFTHLVIAGGGGLGREIAIYARDGAAAGWEVGLRGFLDDTGADGNGLAPCLGGIDAYVPQPRDGVLIAVGGPADRLEVARRLAARGARFATLVHPLAYVAEGAVLDEGCVVAPFATIGTGARLGAHCLINTHAGIGHDASLGQGSVVSPHGVVNGFARLGAAVLVGSSAVVTPGREVGDRAQVSAGSVVLSDVPAGATAWGNPARLLPAAP